MKPTLDEPPKKTAHALSYEGESENMESKGVTEEESLRKKKRKGPCVHLETDFGKTGKTLFPKLPLQSLPLLSGQKIRKNSPLRQPWKQAAQFANDGAEVAASAIGSVIQ